jgi:hypothetical protein
MQHYQWAVSQRRSPREKSPLKLLSQAVAVGRGRRRASDQTCAENDGKIA